MYTRQKKQKTKTKPKKRLGVFGRKLKDFNIIKKIHWNSTGKVGWNWSLLKGNINIYTYINKIKIA